ncbi:MAG: M42 family peptidase [Chloroflexi bacterium]|nr:M42 family peptidase [Chloroflexota bacterium]
MSLFETLKMYCEIPGPGSREERVHTRALERWQPHAREAWRSAVGNVFAHIGGDGPKLLLLGHGDEIGFALKYIAEDGFLYFTTGQRELRGHPEWRGMYASPIGQPALIVGRDVLVEGVFASLTGHILTPTQRDQHTLGWNDLFVDAFFRSREEAQDAGVHIGDRIIWNPPTRAFGKFYSGKAMDNRVSLALLEALLPRLEPSRLRYDLYIGSSVMEEGGLYGAHSVQSEVACEYAIAIDTGLSGDAPGVDPRDVPTRLGGGPTLIHKDLYGYSFRLNNAIRDAAAAAGLPLQHTVHGFYGTDSGALLQKGVAASAIGVPTRYTHSPFETLHADDLEATLELLLAILYAQPPAGF